MLQYKVNFCDVVKQKIICTEKSSNMISFREKYKNQIKNLADTMQNEAMPALTEELFALFETTGNRLQYEDVYFARRKFLAVFGMVAYIFGRKEDTEKLEEVLLEICAEECWALPAHVNRKDNPDWRNSVDLFASETAQALAEIITSVEGISDKVKEMVRGEIERRVFAPFEYSRQGWECSDHNWNAVCCGSIGSAALHLFAGKEEKRLNSFLERICHSLTFYLNGFREDGACMEGIGYFTYGMTYFTGFAEQLLRYSNGKINLYDNTKLRKIAEFQQKMYFSSGQTVSFSDGETKAKFRMGLTAFLAKQYDTVRLPNQAFAADFETDPCYRFMGLFRDYEWTKEEMPAEDASCMVRHDVLPEAQWSICESRNGIGFAIKGGNNGEPHNHNDVGSFLYLVAGEQLICDLGAGEYTAEYFGPGRYDILCNSSEGHSVPIVNGGFQQAGANFGASLFESDGVGKTKIEFSGAYQDGAVHKLTRETWVSLEDGSLTVKDGFELPSGGIFTENLVTKGTVILQENIVWIQGRQASCKVEIESQFTNLRAVEKLHSNHEGEQETIRVIQWDVIPKIQTGEKGEQYYGVSKYTVWKC